MNKSVDVAIVGGGVVGLSAAWRLAREGASVTLIERGLVGREASGAAAGMLAPFAEAKTRGPFQELGFESLKRYPKFVDELKADSNLDCELVRTGLLRVAEGDEDEKELHETFRAMQEIGSKGEWVGSKELHEMEPVLSDCVTAAIYSPTEWQLEVKRFSRALAVAGANKGVKLIEHTEAIGFKTSGNRFEAVITPGGEISAGKLLVAGGSWNKTIAGWLGIDIPVRPIRGQIVSLGPCFPLPVSHTVYSSAGYLVPKSDGRVIVGSTEDDAGFDSRPTAYGVAEILARSARLAPGLASATVEGCWAGLRPFSIDRMPIFGRAGDWENAYLAAGHFRNGILLTPISSEICLAMLLTGKTDIDPAFSPDRFKEI